MKESESVWLCWAVWCEEDPEILMDFFPVSLERVLKLINWSNGRFQDFTQHSDSLQTCHFSPSGTLLFTVAFNEILLWDVQNLWGTHLSVEPLIIFLLVNQYFYKLVVLRQVFVVGFFNGFLKGNRIWKIYIFCVLFFLINKHWNIYEWWTDSLCTLLWH